MKKTLLILSMVAGFAQLTNAQVARVRSIAHYSVNYPEIVLPSSYHTFSFHEFDDSDNTEMTAYMIKDLKENFKLSNLTQVDYSMPADIKVSVGLKDRKDYNIEYQLVKGSEKSYLTIKAKNTAGLIVTDNIGYIGRESITLPFADTPEKIKINDFFKSIESNNEDRDEDTSDKAVYVELEIPTQYIEEYIDFDKSNNTFWLKQSYKDGILKKQVDNLLTRIKARLRYDYELGIENSKKTYYLGKDIPEENEFNTLLKEDLTIAFKAYNTPEDLPKVKENLVPLIEKLKIYTQKYSITDKKEAKIVWAAFMDLGQIYKYTNQFDLAVESFKNASLTGFRELYANMEVRYTYQRKKNYEKLFDAMGNRKDIVPIAYIERFGDEGSSKIKEVAVTIEAKKGILYDKDDKYEGMISITNSKKAEVTYEQKGKTKTKDFKAKDLVSICYEDGVCYDGFDIKTSFLADMINGDTSATPKLPGMGLIMGASERFYKRLYENEKVTINVDDSDPNNGYLIRLKKDEYGYALTKETGDKFFRKASKVFDKCNDLEKAIERGEYQNTIEDLQKMADVYNTCVKK